jgi:hypothetical protein
MPGAKKDFFRVNTLAWADKYLGAIFPFNYLGWNVIVRARTSPLAPKMVPLAVAGPKVPVAGALVQG